MVELVGPASVRGALHDLGADPAFVAGDDEIRVDLYRVADAALARVLDPFEGFDPGNPAASPYVREQVPVVEHTSRAWIYRYNGTPAGPRVDGGDWVAHLAREARDGTLGPDAGP